MKPIVIDIRNRKGILETFFKKQSTVDITFEMIKERLSLQEIAQKRNMTLGTIQRHVCELVEQSKINVTSYIPFPLYEEVESLIKQGKKNKEIVEEQNNYSYFQVKLVRSELNRLSKIKCYE
jgi:uncharacterized protein YpbB